MSRLPILLCVLAASSAQAQGLAGVWRTFSDHRGEAESLVRIEEHDGSVTGTVTQVFSPPASSPNPLCEACAGALKGKPIVGMKILNGRSSGEGEILDPDDGRVYRCILTLVQGGAKLEVRGYLGVPLFGRTQVWQRVE